MLDHGCTTGLVTCLRTRAVNAVTTVPWTFQTSVQSVLNTSCRPRSSVWGRTRTRSGCGSSLRCPAQEWLSGLWCAGTSGRLVSPAVSTWSDSSWAVRWSGSPRTGLEGDLSSWLWLSPASSPQSPELSVEDTGPMSPPGSWPGWRLRFVF